MKLFAVALALLGVSSAYVTPGGNGVPAASSFGGYHAGAVGPYKAPFADNYQASINAGPVPIDIGLGKSVVGGFQSPVLGGYKAQFVGGYKVPIATGYKTPLFAGYKVPLASGYKGSFVNAYSAPIAGVYKAPFVGAYKPPLVGGYKAQFSGGYQVPFAGGYKAPPFVGGYSPVAYSAKAIAYKGAYGGFGGPGIGGGLWKKKASA